MDWERVSNDQVDQVLGHLFSGVSVFLAEICDWLIEADRRQQFTADGSPDLVQWVSARFGLRHSTAGQLVRVARRLQDLPLLHSRFAEGGLSLDHVDAISRMATPDTEEALIVEALGLSNAVLDRAARRANPPSASDERTVWERRRLGLQWNLDESELRFGGNLPGAEGRIFEESITERADRIPENPETGMFDLDQTRCADALVEVCASSGDQGSAPVQVTVHADLQALTTNTETSGVAELESSPVIANQTARRLACDSIVETSVYDQDRILGVGRRTRIIPLWLRRQLYHRDGGCRFPGCGRTRWAHGHHIEHWADGGATDLDNLVVLCGFHHRFLHEHEWRIQGDPGGRLTFKKPDGRIYPPVRPGLDPRLRELVRT